MKNTFRLIPAVLAAIAVLAGCVQEITSPSFEKDKVNPAAEGSRIIAVSFSQQTKTYLDKDGLQPKFEDGKDTVLISNTNALDTCVVSVDDKTKVATITTNLTGPLTAVYPYTAAGMNENNENEIDTVLVSTIQSGKFADANICMAKMKDEKDESLSFENKTAVFCIYPPAGKDAQLVKVSAEGFVIANNIPAGSAITDSSTIHVNTTTADSVWVSILVPGGLTVGDLKFSDGTKEKAITTGGKAATAIAAGTLYTVTNEGWESPKADTPDGAIKGVFTVGAGPDGKAGTADDIKVHFSQGNLYCSRTSSETNDWTWHFYGKQYQFNSNATSSGSRIAIDDDTEIDLFTWGYDNTSSNDSYSFNPVNTKGITAHTTTEDKQLVYNTDSGDDWGVAYCNSNNITVGT